MLTNNCDDLQIHHKWKINIKSILNDNNSPGEFNDIKTFWKIYNNLLPPSKLFYKCSYFVMQDKEEPQHMKYHKMSPGFYLSFSKDRDIDQIWMKFLMFAICGYSDIKGLSIYINKLNYDFYIFTTETKEKFMKQMEEYFQKSN
jgi:hypothetical protein